MNKPKAFPYYRMSSDRQIDGDSLRRQEAAVATWAGENNDVELVTDAELKDLGVSAYTGENVTSGALGRFIAGIQSKAIPAGSYLLVESLDRLSRQEPMIALSKFLDIVSKGIVLVTLADNRRYSSDNGRLRDYIQRDHGK